MTIATQITEVTFTGNSAAVDFDFEFPVHAKTDMEVIVITIATGVETAIADAFFDIEFNEDYTGTVTYPTSGSPLSSAYQIQLRRQVEYTQEAEISNQRKFYPRVIEKQLDHIVMQTQQLDRRQDELVVTQDGYLARSFRVPAGETVDELPAATARASGFVYLDTAGNTEVVSLPDLGEGTPLNLTTVTSRALLGALLPSIKLAFLDEGKRFGLFKYDSGDWSSSVTYDPEQGVYVAVNSDPTGASGAWIRQSNVVTPEMFGAVGDCNLVARTGTDDADALEAFLVFCGRFKVEGSITGTYLASRKLEADLAIACRINGFKAAIYWPATNTTFGIRLVPVDDQTVTRGNFSGITFYTGSAASPTTAHVGFEYDNYRNIANTADKDRINYGVVGGAGFDISFLSFLGIAGVITTGWYDGVRMNCAPNCTLSGITGRGQRDITTEQVRSRWIVHSSAHDYDIRTITNFTVAAGVATVTWNTATGNYFGYPNADSAGGYVYLRGFAGALGEVLNDRNFRITNVNNIAGTFELRLFDATNLPAYTSGGFWEGAPQAPGLTVQDGGGTWYGIYLAQGEGQAIINMQFTGSNIGYMIEEQLSLLISGTTHTEYKTRGMYARGVGGVVLDGMSFIKGDPSPRITISGVTLASPGVFTYTGTAPPGLYDNARVIFDVTAGMVELHNDALYVDDLDTGAKTFRLRVLSTGNYLNTSTYTAWTTGICEIIGITMELENCNDFIISNCKYSVAAGGCDPITLRNCDGGFVFDNLFSGRGAYAAIRLEGTVEEIELKGFRFATNKFNQIVENNTSSTSIYYSNRPHDINITVANDTLVTSSAFGNDVTVGSENIRLTLNGESRVLHSLHGGYYNRRMTLFNETQADTSGAAVFTVASNHGDAVASRAFRLNNNMPHFLLPGASLPVIYDAAVSRWVVDDSSDWKNSFDVYSDLITANDFETTTGGAGASIVTGTLGTGGSVLAALGVQRLICTTNLGGVSHGMFTAELDLGRHCSLFACRVGTSVLSTVAQEYILRAGFFDGGGNTATVTDGVWFEYNRLENVVWQMKTSNLTAGGGVTAVASTKTVLVNRYDWLYVFVSSDQFGLGKATFGWGRNGTDFETLHTTALTIPLTAGPVGFGVQLVKTAGGGEVGASIDFIGAAVNRLRT